jgi:hypothetical protein
MENWKKFEIESENFLRKLLEPENYSVLRKGGNNSNDPDIEIFKNGKLITKIEVKHSPSQSGQIVVFQELGKFRPSNIPKVQNEFTTELINELNSNPTLRNLGTSPVIEIPLKSELIFNWITSHYKSKGVNHLITSSKTSERYFSIIDINEINNHFKSKATLRIKRSGTRDIPTNSIPQVKVLVSTYLKELGIKENEYTIERGGKKLYLKIKNDTLGKKYIQTKYYISKDKPGSYIIKIRANTKNLNIIFGLEYKGEKGIGINEYIKYLNNIK